MKEILTSHSRYALVDDEDYEKVAMYKWYAVKLGNRADGYYACGNIKKDGKYHTIYMSRLIMNPQKEMVVDHINHNTLDNRKENLRICTRRENTKNRVKNNGNKSGYKGVCWNKNAQKWQAQIMTNYKKLYLGVFDDKEAAFEAYTVAAKKYHGIFHNID